jgi:hypothetical protein
VRASFDIVGYSVEPLDESRCLYKALCMANLKGSALHLLLNTDWFLGMTTGRIKNIRDVLEKKQAKRSTKTRSKA